MKTVIQIFVATLCLAILGQTYLQAVGTQKYLSPRVSLEKSL